MDDEREPSDTATAAGVSGVRQQNARGPQSRVTPGRFVGALAVACVLLFVMLAVFAFAGLGPLGIWPAVVVATSLTARVTKIRRMPVLVALAVLSFVIVVAITYAIAIAIYLNAPG